MLRRLVTRLLVGTALCLLLGAGVAVSGAGRWLPLGGVVPPAVPRSWAPPPTAGRVDVTLVSSPDLVGALAAGLDGGTVARREAGALALVDGRVFAASTTAARGVLSALAWDGLPISARRATPAQVGRFEAPAPAPLSWRARHELHLGLQSARELLVAHPSFAVTSLVAWLMLLLHTGVVGVPKRTSADISDSGAAPSTWRRRHAEQPVRVVLVSDLATLNQVRTAIGEENVIAATEHAFAFADGWILAVRKGSVFELASELGWRLRPIEMATRSELVEEGHDLAPRSREDACEALDLLDALHVCGPIAHGTLPPLATGAFSGA